MTVQHHKHTSKKNPWIITLALIIFSASCASSNIADGEGRMVQKIDQSQIADLILYSGAIYTVSENQEWAEAVAIKDGKILAVGTDDQVAEYQGASTRVMDMGGRMVMPGIHDVHMHPLESGSTVGGTCELTANTPPEEFIDLLRECAPNQIATDWVLGAGHSISALQDSERLPIAILDEAIPDQPAIMLEETSHSTWANSAAMAAAGIDKNTPDPPGGIIDRDPETGELTGILYENAGNMLFHLAFAPNAELDELNYEGLIYSLGELAANGITSVADARAYWKRNHILGLWAYPALDDDEQIAALIAMYNNPQDSLLRINQVKMYSDGIISNGTAAMLEPFAVDLLELPGNVGMNYFDETRLTRYVTELGAAGFDLHIHTLGDRAVREGLNAIQAAQTANPDRQARHRLTHVEVVHPDDIGRFAELGVIADFQVAGDFTLPAHVEENKELIGDRAINAVPIKSVYETDAVITLSSDWDVSPLSPFVGMQNALNRDPQSLPDLHAVIEAYTINGAYVMRQEDRTGSIEVGKWADLIVLDQNLFDIPTDQINKTQVLLTMLAGEVIHEEENFYVHSIYLPIIQG